MIKLLAFTLTFVFLLCLMHKYHRYEYQLRKKSMVSHFVILSLFVIIHNALSIRSNFCITMYASPENNNAMDNFNDDVIKCFNEPPYAFMFNITVPMAFISLPMILIAYSAFKIKHLSDPLEGLSKLDNIVLISRFQKQNQEDNFTLQGSLYGEDTP